MTSLRCLSVHLKEMPNWKRSLMRVLDTYSTVGDWAPCPNRNVKSMTNHQPRQSRYKAESAKESAIRCFNDANVTPSGIV